MLVDFEDYLFDFLVSPNYNDVLDVLKKYKSASQQPIFEVKGNSCLERRQPEVEKCGGNCSRLPARFEFDSAEHAKGFSEFITLHWYKILESTLAA